MYEANFQIDAGALGAECEILLSGLSCMRYIAIHACINAS